MLLGLGEGHDRSFGARLWHVFGLVDTRQATFIAPGIDLSALGKTVFYVVLATILGHDRSNPREIRHLMPLRLWVFP